MTQVMTVTGPIEASNLGFTLMHEHLLLDLLKDSWDNKNDPISKQIKQRIEKEGGKYFCNDNI